MIQHVTFKPLMALVLMAVAVVLVTPLLAESRARAEVAPETGVVHAMVDCEDDAVNAVVNADSAWLTASGEGEVEGRHRYCRKVKTSCAKWYHYLDCDRNGNCKAKKTCDKWNYRIRCFPF